MARDRSEDAFSPFVTNSEAAERFIGHAGTDHHSVFSTMMEDAAEIAEGDLSSLEQRLVSQAITLDAMFTSLASKAAGMMEWESVEAAERALKLALKAQAQGANTMKILSEIKQPKSVAFAKQVNVAHQQYVHHGQEPPALHARGEKTFPHQKLTNELIQPEGTPHATLDTGSPQTPLTVDASEDSRH